MLAWIRSIFRRPKKTARYVCRGCLVEIPFNRLWSRAGKYPAVQYRHLVYPGMVCGPVMVGSATVADVYFHPFHTGTHFVENSDGWKPIST